MGFLQANHEFEYLTCRLSFLNGLLSWLGAVALKYAIPQPEEGESTRKMNRFAASLLTSTMVLMVSFYNAHLNFYPNYIQMVLRWCKLAWHGVVGDRPAEPRKNLLRGLPVPGADDVPGLQGAFTAKPDEGSDWGFSYGTPWPEPIVKWPPFLALLRLRLVTKPAGSARTSPLPPGPRRSLRLRLVTSQGRAQAPG